MLSRQMRRKIFSSASASKRFEMKWSASLFFSPSFLSEGLKKSVRSGYESSSDEAENLKSKVSFFLTGFIFARKENFNKFLRIKKQ